MTSDDPTLVRYYALVEAMQAARGQRTYVGRDLAALAPTESLVLERADTVPVTLPAPVAARLHALNFRTWRNNPFILANVDRRRARSPRRLAGSARLGRTRRRSRPLEDGAGSPAPEVDDCVEA